MSSIENGVFVEDVNITLYAFNKDYDYYLSFSLPQSKVTDEGWYTTVAPPEHKDGFVQVFNPDEQKWLQIVDNRGRFAYRHDTEEASIVDYIGELKDGFTLITPDVVDASRSIIS